jgi:sialidase-1
MAGLRTQGYICGLSYRPTAIGLAIALGADASTIDYSIDGAAYQQKDIYTKWSSFLHVPWYIFHKGILHKGSNRLKIKLAYVKNTKSKATRAGLYIS